MRKRKRAITDIKLKKHDIEKLTHGNRVYKNRKNHVHCLIPMNVGKRQNKKRKGFWSRLLGR